MIDWNALAGDVLWANGEGAHNYNDLAYALVSKEEGFRENPYLDTADAHNPTIGIGFNLRDPSILGSVLVQLGLGGAEAAAYQTQISDAIGNEWGSNNSLQIALNAIILDAYNGGLTEKTTFNLTDVECRGVFNAIAPHYETVVTSHFPALHDAPLSRERAVLFSLAYNAPDNGDLIGPNLLTAIATGDRAEAWYEIRYNTNADSLIDLNTVDADERAAKQATIEGAAKRRYVESHIFGLHDQIGAAAEDLTKEDALGVFRMFNRHEEKIRTYDARFGGEGAELGNQIAAADGDLSAIETGSTQELGAVVGRDESFASAQEFLAAVYLSFNQGHLGHPEPGVDVGLAAWNVGQSSLRSELENIHDALPAEHPGLARIDALLDLRDELQEVFVASEDSVAGEVAAHTVDRPSIEDDEFGGVAVGPTRDLIFGTNGDDTLLAGGADDAVVGGAGADSIDGGDGVDVVIYAESGAGVDVDLGAGTAAGGDAAGDTLVGVENVIGSALGDTLVGNAGDNILIGLAGNDQFGGSAGNDVIAGGAGSDELDYSGSGEAGIEVRLGQAGAILIEKPDGRDAASSIETLTGSEFDDTITVGDGSAIAEGGRLAIDGGGGFDKIDFGGATGAVESSTLEGGDVLFTLPGGGEIRIHDIDTVVGSQHGDNLELGTGVMYADGGAGDDSIHGGDDYAELVGGEGRDSIFAAGHYSQVFFGDGDDMLVNAASGTIIHGGAGNDRFNVNDNLLIADAEAGDSVWLFGSAHATGALHWGASDSAMAVADSGLFRYGINVEGDLVVKDFLGRETFIADYVGGPGAPYNAAGIFVAAASFDSYRILDPDLPSAEILRGSFKVLSGEMESKYGSAYALPEYSDPLVFDLDGDGVELTALTSVAPYFDFDGDRFAEQAGWVRPDDALLALDANANGRIDGIGELFGAQGGSGFAELATHDGNEDGRIDSLDSAWSDLVLWRDLDQDGVTDAGELTGLDAAGIASISLTSTPQTGVTNANNIVAAAGSFTRTDETTGAVADIRFRMDDYETRFTGDTSVSTEAAALPEVKGHGRSPVSASP